MSTYLFFYRVVLRMKLMRLFRPELRRLVSGKTVNIEVKLGGKVLYLAFFNGNLTLKSTMTEPCLVKISFRSLSLAQNVIKSAMAGDQFWLVALRDHRVNVSGDMSVLLWFFSLCRHLPFRMN